MENKMEFTKIKGDTFEYDDVIIKLKEPKTYDIKVYETEDDCGMGVAYFYIKDDVLDVEIMEETEQFVKDGLYDWVYFVYEAYMIEDDEQLTQDAIEYKNRLLSLFDIEEK